MNDIKENAKYERRMRAIEARKRLAKEIIRYMEKSSSTAHFYNNRVKTNEPNKKNN